MKINKYRKLDSNQKKMRISIMDMIIKESRPVNLSEVKEYVKETLKLEDTYVNDNIKTFIDENIMVVNDENNIDYIYPVSAHPTMHKVTLADGREFSAMCAIDALGCRCTFHQDIEINSICSVTGENINISVKNSKIDYINNNNLRILHLNLDKYANWAASCWNIMNFFWTKNEFDAWTKENGFDNNEDIYCLDIDGAMEASYDIFYVS